MFYCCPVCKAKMKKKKTIEKKEIINDWLFIANVIVYRFEVFFPKKWIFSNQSICKFPLKKRCLRGTCANSRNKNCTSVSKYVYENRHTAQNNNRWNGLTGLDNGAYKPGDISIRSVDPSINDFEKFISFQTAIEWSEVDDCDLIHSKKSKFVIICAIYVEIRWHIKTVSVWNLWTNWHWCMIDYVY